MSDMPKCLKATSRIRWGVFTAATLLTVMSCALLVVRLVNKRIDRWGNKLLQAYAVQRLGALAEILPDNVTQLHGRK